MSHAFRVLSLSFVSRGDLEREYFSNLVNGGLFIPGSFSLLEGEPVMVFVDLPFASGSIELNGCVARSVRIASEANYGRCGVALELENFPREIQKLLETEVGENFPDDERGEARTRVAPRSVARVRARVNHAGGSVSEGYTENLSLGGVLVAITGMPPALGEDVRVSILHPKNGEDKTISGRIMRHQTNSNGEVCGIGIQFSVENSDVEETTRYLSGVKASEHARRLGGISGSISTLGVSDLLSSFGQCVSSGQFTLSNHDESGFIQISKGLVGAVHLGPCSGIKALVEMLAWEEGSFEFHALTGVTSEPSEMSMPIELALLEGARLLDEGRRYSRGSVAASLPEGLGTH